MSELSFCNSVLVNQDILFQELTDGESVFLNLNNELYFGLDQVGTDMWKTLTNSKNIQEAYDKLVKTYDVDEKTLKEDLKNLINKLVENGLLKISES